VTNKGLGVVIGYEDLKRNLQLINRVLIEDLGIMFKQEIERE
jgi:hypothetical protein